MAPLLARPLGSATLPDLLARPLGTRPLPLTRLPLAGPRAAAGGLFERRRDKGQAGLSARLLRGPPAAVPAVSSRAVTFRGEGAQGAKLVCDGYGICVIEFGAGRAGPFQAARQQGFQFLGRSQERFRHPFERADKIE